MIAIHYIQMLPGIVPLVSVHDEPDGGINVISMQYAVTHISSFTRHPKLPFVPYELPVFRCSAVRVGRYVSFTDKRASATTHKEGYSRPSLRDGDTIPLYAKVTKETTKTCYYHNQLNLRCKNISLLSTTRSSSLHHQPPKPKSKIPKNPPNTTTQPSNSSQPTFRHPKENVLQNLTRPPPPSRPKSLPPILQPPWTTSPPTSSSSSTASSSHPPSTTPVPGPHLPLPS